MGCGGSKTSTTNARSPRRSQGGNRGGQRNRKAGGGGAKKTNQGKQPKQTPRHPVAEKGYKKRIRENLREATAGDDIPFLDRCIVIFENNHLEDGGDLTDAKNRMDFLLTRKEIREACMRNHPVVLDKAIAKVEASKYKRQLQPWLDRANYLKRNQNDLEQFRHNISQLEQSTISEIRSYKQPSSVVHEAMIPTYMVIGYKEEDLLDWNDVQALMGRIGKESLLREAMTADTSHLNDHTALRAKYYLNKHSLEEVRSVSNGAAAFHLWATQMIGKYESDRKGGGQAAPREANLPKKGNRPQQKKEKPPLTKEEQKKLQQQKKKQLDAEKKRQLEAEKKKQQAAQQAAQKQKNSANTAGDTKKGNTNQGRNDKKATNSTKKG